MADDSAASDDAPITFHVKSSGNAKYTFTLPSSTTTIDLKNKLATSEYANIPPESQRLIYSGKVLKDTDTLATHKVKDGNTMHLVKSAPSNQRQNPASSASATPSSTPNSSSAPAVPGVPTNLASGTGNDVLAGLTGARYAGFAPLPGAGTFGPDGGMGPPPSQEQMIEMMSNPAVAQAMNEALQNPAMIDMMIQQNPALRAMGPQARQILQSEEFRRMVTDPNAMRMAAQTMGMGGLGGMGGMGGQQNSAFPAPGETNTTATENRDQSTANTQQGQPNANPPNPFSFLGGSQGLQGNPFASPMNPAFAPQQPPSSEGQNNPTNNGQAAQNPFGMLFNPALFGQQPQQNPQTGTTSPPPQQNSPWGDPAMLNNLMQAFGGANAGAGGTNPYQNLLGGLGGTGSPPAPPDNRPPEERFSEQLRQLNDMGFYDFDRNIQALTRSGGSVQGAIEHLLGQP